MMKEKIYNMSSADFARLVSQERSIRQICISLGLTPNTRYSNFVKERIKKDNLNTDHFGYKKYTYFKEAKLREAIKKSSSIAQVLDKLGLNKYGGGNYQKINSLIKNLGLDISHFKGLAINKGKKFVPKYQRRLDEILVKNSDYLKTSNLKQRLYKEGLLKEECRKCGNKGKWKGSDLVLQLEHINGDHSDNRIENLEILCPNCHSQTKTFSGRRLKSDPKKCGCGKEIHRRSKKCFDCSIKSRKLKNKGK